MLSPQILATAFTDQGLAISTERTDSRVASPETVSTRTWFDFDIDEDHDTGAMQQSFQNLYAGLATALDSAYFTGMVSAYPGMTYAPTIWSGKKLKFNTFCPC